MHQAHQPISYFSTHGAAQRPAVSRADRRRPGLNHKDRVVDICAITLWAVSIPALMWLGAVAGF